MAQSNKPAIVVIPGAACPVVFYNDLVSSLKQHGHEAETHNLRSYSDDATSEPKGLAEDAAYFHDKIEALVDEGKDVVVVGHSYGGLVTTDATHGLSKAERQGSGKRGGVVRIIYLTCIVGAVGSSSTETTLDRLPKYSFMEPADENGNFFRQIASESARIVFNDLPHEEGVAWVGKMYNQSAKSFADKIQHASYLHSPVTWILCTKDEVLTPSFQRGCIEFIEKEKKGAKVDVVELDVGHCPNVSAIELTAKTIAEAVERNA